MSEVTYHCQQPDNEDARATLRDLCGTMAGLVGVTDTTQTFSEHEVQAGQNVQDPFGIHRMQAGTRMLGALARDGGARALVDNAVPPEVRCPTCPLRDICAPPTSPMAN